MYAVYVTGTYAFLALIKSAAFSAIAYTVDERWVPGIIGIIEASTTDSFETPYTIKFGPTTPPKFLGSILAVPLG